MQHTEEFQVEVQPDFIEKITRAKPLQALSELVWNALDADAHEVRVYFERNELDSLSAVIVRDDGDGDLPPPAIPISWREAQRFAG